MHYESNGLRHGRSDCGLKFKYSNYVSGGKSSFLRKQVTSYVQGQIHIQNPKSTLPKSQNCKLHKKS